MDIKEIGFIRFLEGEGYFDIRFIEGRGYCGLKRFMFTTGLVLGLDETGFYGRYCFHTLADARDAFKDWDGLNDPEGEWIKYKGVGGDRSRLPDPFEK